MAYKGCFLETSQIFTKFKGWSSHERDEEKMNNKDVMLYMIYGFS